jgi:hypothetical protein
MTTTAYLLFVLLLDATGQPMERQLHLPTSLAQCQQWEQQATAAVLANQPRSVLTLRTRCEAITTETV